MKWFRLYTEIVDDRKLRRLSPSQRWLWVAMMCVARKSPVPGVLLLSENVPVNIDDLSDIAAISKEEVLAGIEAFKHQGMLDETDGVYQLINWDKRQFTSDNSTERVKRLRERKRNDNETLQQRYSNNLETPPETETDTDTETEREIDGNSLLFENDVADKDPNATPISRNEYTPEFEKWYSAWPRAEAKKDSFRNFEKIRKSDGLGLIWQCTNNYLAYRKSIPERTRGPDYSSRNFFGQKSYYEDFIKPKFYVVQNNDNLINGQRF